MIFVIRVPMIFFHYTINIAFQSYRKYILQSLKKFYKNLILTLNLRYSSQGRPQGFPMVILY
jgi:hypothetical protein